MALIKIKSPEYLVTAEMIINYLKEKFLFFSNVNIYTVYIDNPSRIIKDFVKYLYDDEALPTKENIDELTQEIKDYLNIK